MKKTISLLLALVLLFALTACSSEPDTPGSTGAQTSKPEILGTYVDEVDITEKAVEIFDIGAGFTGRDLSLGTYLDKFVYRLIYQFNEDGTYSVAIDADSLDAARENMEKAVIPAMDEYMLIKFIEEFAGYGLTIETRADVEEVLDTPWEELVPSVLEMELSELAEIMVDLTITDLSLEGIHGAGRYKAEDGKLYLSNDPNVEADDYAYETYEINGNIVTFTGGVNIEGYDENAAPYYLTKVEAAE